MRKLLALSLLLAAALASAAPTYVTNNVWNGTIPVTFGPQTPGTGNAVHMLLFTNSTASGVFSATGSVTTLANVPVVGASPCAGGCANYTDGHGDTFSLWGALSSGAGPQTYSITQPATDNLLRTVQLEFSGVVSVKSPLYTVTASPGAGAGAVLGQSITVASGDILVVICFNADAFGNAPTVSTAGSTLITTFNDVRAVYWVGTGAAIQPNFTAAVGDTTTPHIVNQWIESATSSGGSCTHSGYTSSGSLATPNGTTGSYIGKSGASVTPDCSSINYWQPTIGNFGVN